MRSLRKNREGQNQELLSLKPLTAAEQNSQISWFDMYRKWEKTSKKNGTYNNMQDDPLGPPQKYEKSMH